MIFTNPTADAMWRPLPGPRNPFRGDAGEASGRTRNAVTGYVEKTQVDPATFDTAYATYNTYGYTMNPTEGKTGFVGDLDRLKELKGVTTASASTLRVKSEELRAEKKKRKQEFGDPADLDKFKGPWAPSAKHLEAEKEIAEQKPTEEQLAHAAAQEEKKKRPERKEHVPIEETSEFHGSQLRDYQGRSYVHIPSDLKLAPPERCYVPKKWIHTWNGHTKGVHAIRFFPGSGHLLLSASMDSTIKVWDVHGQRKCLRTFNGHTEGVRDINFTPDGRHFISASYDRYIKYWDTETGQCISRHTSKKVPFCAVLHPENSNEVLVGQSNKKVVQWDMREDKMTQEYDEHLGPVNTITFIDNNRRFVSTSDDKKIFVWEYGIPVVIKHISEPDMHSMPAVAMSPNGKYFVGQSQDNQILMFDAFNRFKLNRKKRFVGHLCAGYAIGLSFSPDGSLLMSGDAEGRLFFWSFKKGTIYKKIKAHDQVVIGCAWNPLEPSRVATCSWDGTIKYWD